ncbi:hypothetical protein ACFTY7_04630 [Streptomyces sp. NPDC057062]|uniref:hypothetical protein n=1 Tax=Streptomyces sp. NPDC057062 TaxID=3346011 RepID=UPI0036337190
MSGIPWDTALAVFGLAVSGAAAVWEFTLVGRKLLGYRVQMDTTAQDAAAAPYAGVLQQMQHNGTPLRDPSFVLLRIENSGRAPIVEDDYLAPDGARAGSGSRSGAAVSSAWSSPNSAAANSAASSPPTTTARAARSRCRASASATVSSNCPR